MDPTAIDEARPLIVVDKCMGWGNDENIANRIALWQQVLVTMRRCHGSVTFRSKRSCRLPDGIAFAGVKSLIRTSWV